MSHFSSHRDLSDFGISTRIKAMRKLLSQLLGRKKERDEASLATQ